MTKTRPNAKILVFMDLGNISTQLRLLTKRCKQNKNISFYNWLAFEKLLEALTKGFPFEYMDLQTPFIDFPAIAL